MAGTHEAHGVGIQPRQRELLGLLLALISAGTLLTVAASARAWGGIGVGPGTLSIEVGTGGSAATSLKYLAINQTPLQPVLLIGALVLVGSGVWRSIGLAARIARVVVLVIGVLVGVLAAYGALLIGVHDDFFYGDSVAADARISLTAVALAISASTLVAARIAFGLLPIGEAAAAETTAGESEAGGPPAEPIDPAAEAAGSR
jgi:hypothetical protein